MELNKIKEEALEVIGTITNFEEFKQVKSKIIGKDSTVNGLMSKLSTLPREERGQYGKAINELKKTIENELETKYSFIKNKQIETKLSDFDQELNMSDIFVQGSRHPLNRVRDIVYDFFKSLGFRVTESGEIEVERFNFTNLNMPENHPARGMQDTFYLENGKLLRTHCTSNTARVLEANPNSEVRAISIGKVYRNDEDDATHSHQFMQIDIVNIGKNISIANLKWTFEKLMKKLFGSDTQVRMRPSYFPFTEPSWEVDIKNESSNGKWIEILGAGMLHPKVLEAAGYTDKNIVGFASGIGVERIAMLKYGIKNIRDFYKNDPRVLKQFDKVVK